MEKLKAELAKVKQENAELSNKVSAQQTEESKFFTKEGQLIDSYVALENHLPKKIFESVRKILYGPQTPEIALKKETVNRASNLDVEVKQFKINCESEQLRAPRIVKVAAVQNKIVLPPSSPVS